LRCLSIAVQGLFENVDHDPEHSFKCVPHTRFFPQKLGGEGYKWTGSVDILEVFERKIVANELSRIFDGARIYAETVAS
jgi:hypothetical protein